jgi:4-hydroxy 2-oxovalerate aldolase
MNPKRLFIQDVTLRDGSHAIRHRFTTDQVRTIAAALDASGVASIEVGHGDGLAGSSLNFGPSPEGDIAWIDAAASVVTCAQLTTVLLPGIGTIEDMLAARDHGVHGIRLATMCTEADIANQHIAMARALGMDTSGFLMMSARATPDVLAGQAKIMEAAGAQCVFIADSSGQMTMRAYLERVRAVRDALASDTEVGIHAHHNLGLSVASSILAVEEGVTRVDGSLAGMGAGAGNMPIEAFIAAIDLEGWDHGCDLFALMDAADDLVRPLQDRPVRVDRETLSLGYAGVYGSFLRPAEFLAERYGLETRTILVEAGKRSMVAGQEDLLTDIALNLVNQRDKSLAGAGSGGRDDD